MTRRGWRRPVAAVGLAVLVAVCASGAGGPQAVSAASDLGPLPADRYQLTSQDYQRSQQAAALLVQQCMVDRGHPDFPLDPRYPRDPLGMTAVATEYGVLDMADARRWGYGWDPAKFADLRPKGRRMTDAEAAEVPACDREANQRLMRGIDVKGAWLYPSRRAVEVNKAVENDPRLRAAFDEWSRCMAEQGFTGYPDPVAAFADAAWKRGSDGNTGHTQRERTTAVADVACKRRHGTVEAWYAVRVQEQAADIAQHPADYAAGLRGLAAYRANIGAVLRSSDR